MTPLTRRETLLFTAAAAAVTAPIVARAADPEPTYLLVPQNPITDGSAIPVGVSIPPKLLVDNNITRDKIKAVSVELKDTAGSLAIFKMSETVYSVLFDNKNLEFSTRIKVPFSAADGQTKKISLFVAVSVVGADDKSTNLKPGATVDLQVNKSDCMAADIGLFRLSAQPPMVKQKNAVVVKAMVPQPVGARTLSSASASIDDKDALEIQVKDATKLAGEFFIQFSVIPPSAGNLAVTFTYNDGVKNSGSIFIDQDKSS